jgi:GT2 family glycosyltransferase
MKTDLRICVAIPTHNSAEYISELLAYMVTQKAYRIYALDDASTDNTVAMCRQFPEVQVIAGTKNLGPTRNRNRILTEDIGDILVFLDDDMRWRHGDLLATIRSHFTNIELGALGFAIFDSSDKELWFGNERESNPLFFWAERPFIKPLAPHKRITSHLPVQWLLEGAFAVRAELFKELDGFDERFKRYQEGPDLCRRIRAHGFAIGYTHDASFTHTKPLSVFRPSHVGRYIRSGIIWHIRYPRKLKNIDKSK